MQTVINKKYILLIFTFILVVLLYFFGFQKTSTLTMDWKSFKLKTAYFVGFILLYLLAIYILYKK